MFLLVPAHPGCPGQFPQSRKTVVCVVCVYLGELAQERWNILDTVILKNSLLMLKCCV